MLDDPVDAARRACPRLAVTPFQAAVYERKIDPFLLALRRETDRYEVAGPNSAFADFAGGGEPATVVAALARHAAGFALVAGLGRSKFAARVAVDAALAPARRLGRPMYLPLPDLADCAAVRRSASLYLINLLALGVAGEREFIGGLPVGYIWPVGAALRERLYRLGIETCRDLAAWRGDGLRRVLGAGGELLSELARGIDRTPVTPAAVPRQIVRRLELDRPVASRPELQRLLRRLGGDLGRDLVDAGLGCRSIEAVVYQDCGRSAAAERHFARPQAGAGVIGGAAAGLLDRMVPGAPALGLAVSGHGLEPALGEQLSFLVGEPGERRHSAALLRTVATLDRKFPAAKVGFGPPPPSRRERMLRLVDPLRGGKPEPGHPPGLP